MYKKRQDRQEEARFPLPFLGPGRFMRSPHPLKK